MDKNKILIIDDDKDLSLIMGEMLENYGYKVTIACDSEAAFNLLSDNTFHLILLDINLPDITGFELCRELRSVSTVPIIFASARTNAQEAMGVLIPDLTVYLNKSDGNIGWEEVDKLVEECLEIKEKNSYISLYASLNGENLYCEMYENPEYVSGIIKGRAPLYENEIVIRMVVQKSFIQERRVIGIYKAVGFTSDMLRLQFAIRFFIIAVTGSVIGVILSIAFSEKTLELLLSLIGFTKVAVEYTPMTVILPIVAVCICFFVFSFAASWKIKRVEIRELVVE